MIGTVIFDLDGTLTDSFDGIVDSFLHALREHGFPEQDRAVVRGLIGVPLEGMLLRLVPDMEEAVMDALAKSYRDHYITICGETSPLLPGVGEALDILEGRTLVCASTKYTPQVMEVLRTQGIDGRFSLLQGSEDMPKKPAPDLFRLVMEKTGSEPERTAAVGDMVFDVRAALASGCLPVGVLTGIGTREELEGAGCRHVFATLAEAAAFIASVE